MKSGKAEDETRGRTLAKIAALECNASQLKDYSWLSQVLLVRGTPLPSQDLSVTGRAIIPGSPRCTHHPSLPSQVCPMSNWTSKMQAHTQVSSWLSQVHFSSDSHVTSSPTILVSQHAGRTNRSQGRAPVLHGTCMVHS